MKKMILVVMIAMTLMVGCGREESNIPVSSNLIKEVEIEEIEIEPIEIEPIEIVPIEIEKIN